MKIVVIGGTRHIRSRTVKKLRREGHEVEAVSPKIGIDIINTDYFDAGYSGQALRLCLLNIVAVMREMWRYRSAGRGRLGVFRVRRSYSD